MTLAGKLGKRQLAPIRECDVLVCSAGGEQKPSYRFWEKLVFGRGHLMPFVRQHVVVE